MTGRDGNVISRSEEHAGKAGSFRKKLKANGKAEPGDLYKHHLMEEELRKQNNDPSEESHHLSSIAQTYSPSNNINCHSNTSTITERKKRSADSFDNSVLKRLKEQKKNPDMYANLNKSSLISDGFVVQKHENSGSSGKRRRESCDTQEGSEGPKDDGDDSAYKKTKIGRDWDEVQLKMLGPLKLPDYVNGYNLDHNCDPEILRLNQQLVEINKKLRYAGTVDDLPGDDKSPSPPPIYNEVGIRVNTRENRRRAKLSQHKQQIICELNRKIPLFWHPIGDKPTKLTRKLYVPVKQYPDYNFVGILLGPRGLTQKRMEKESGARILLRGKGSARLGKVKHIKDSKNDLYEDEDLHIYIEAEDTESLETASQMVEKLLLPVKEEANLHKHDQLRELAELNSESGVLTKKLQMKGIGNTSDPKSNDPKSGEVVDNANLFVGFLPKSVDTKRLIELFSPFGCLCEAAVIMDKGTGLSKGYGFVKYTDPFAAAKALVRMNGFRVDGKTLAVRTANRAPLTVNTIIGPRGGLRFSSFADNPVSAAIHAPTLGKGVTKESCASSCWDNTAHALQEHVMVLECNSSRSHIDSFYRRRRAF
ncbi:hypothetical protein HPP92_001513 [Vanilla planifolia]|uniref:Branchpoint-bridging protein n=1 Tax=Vanilla planifolia TaxID=51239 RepID=A0A835VFE8_VANPL|nr:hypothetical protein HPP92_001513 [Vanilla planifolia]